MEKSIFELVDSEELIKTLKQIANSLEIIASTISATEANGFHGNGKANEQN